MPSNLNYDPELLEQARVLGNFKYKTDAVNAALREYVQRHQQPKITDLFGKIKYGEDYDYKKLRKRK
jgi:hypothetical protein